MTPLISILAASLFSGPSQTDSLFSYLYSEYFVSNGDTIEVHWVHTSCDVTPGEGLGSCLSDKCANPELRVEAQVFLVVNDSNALDFADFAYAGNQIQGRRGDERL